MWYIAATPTSLRTAKHQHLVFEGLPAELMPRFGNDALNRIDATPSRHSFPRDEGFAFGAATNHLAAPKDD